MGHFSIRSRIAILLYDSMVRRRLAMIVLYYTDSWRLVESANGISIKFDNELSFRILDVEFSSSIRCTTTRASPSRSSNSDWRSPSSIRWRKRCCWIRRNQDTSIPFSSINSPSSSDCATWSTFDTSLSSSSPRKSLNSISNIVSISESPIVSNHLRTLRICAMLFCRRSRRVIGYPRREEEKRRSSYCSPKIVCRFRFPRSSIVADVRRFRRRQSEGRDEVPQRTSD